MTKFVEKDVNEVVLVDRVEAKVTRSVAEEGVEKTERGDDVNDGVPDVDVLMLVLVLVSDDTIIISIVDIFGIIIFLRNNF